MILFLPRCGPLKMASYLHYFSDSKVTSNSLPSETHRVYNPQQPTDYGKRDSEPLLQVQGLRAWKLLFLLSQSTCSLSFESGLD